MMLWTIQSVAAWHVLQTTGTLRTHPRYVDDAYRSAYQWMNAEMEQRIGPRPGGVQWPLWAWLQWEGRRRARPDLRSRGHLPHGHAGVRIAFDPPKVLLSDFELWHYVLNYWYLPASWSEGEAFAAELAERGLSLHATKPLPDAGYHRRIVQSWARIFDVSWTADGIALAPGAKRIQATFWELKLEQVRDVKHFVAR
jgi:hypothetical protein